MSMEKKINLVHPLLGVRGFSVEHAERLMGMRNNGGWQLQEKEVKVKSEVKKGKKKKEQE